MKLTLYRISKGFSQVSRWIPNKDVYWKNNNNKVSILYWESLRIESKDDESVRFYKES